MKVAQKKMTALTSNHFASFYETMKANGDINNAEKIIDLYEKKQNDEFNISFAGHFSAGKSSLINYLLGKDVLPKSPIPTSANIVKITSGKGIARIFFTEATPIEYEEPYDIDMIKDYAMDKDAIKRIEINTSEQILPETCSLIDTPGIDAADDADRLMTESSLHLVDVLYYVMDYNHVQSEVNLYFLQEVQQMHIPFYIIINQIDKHNEKELPFADFDRNVKQTFEQWNIYPEKIYYSSAINEKAPHNEIKEIKTDLFALLKNKSGIGRIDIAANEIISAHKKHLEETFEQSIQELNIDDNDAFELKKLDDINQKIGAIEDVSRKFRDEFADAVNQTLKNAYLMPAKLRDQAGHFLESQQKDFKIGFFNAKRKTEEERQARLQSFLDPLKKTIESSIQWKLRDKFIQMLRDYQINEEHLLEKAQGLDIEYSEKNLLSFIKDGATINGNYILNYTNEVSNDIKNKFRQQTNSLLKEIETTARNKWDKEKAKYEREKQQFKQMQDVAEQKRSLEQQLEDKLKFVEGLLVSPVQSNLEQLHHLLEERNTFIKEKAPVNLNKGTQEANENEQVSHQEKQLEESKTVSYHAADEIAEIIEKVANEITQLDGFSTIAEDLEDKKERLQNRDLTIALFGAFSAGKSSFSNALFGEQILPVSPNPTTAVISRISPVTEGLQHGTVLISFKDEQTLVNDIKAIAKDLEPEENSFDGLIEWIQANQIHEHPNLTKTYQSYLLAVLNGYEYRKNQLGQTVSITLEEFAAFVTDESKACYIETVDLFYDCELTRKGITLVDTPGADSVNARHTNVSFDYIKQADAIIYVTYYNHAITSADRDFLIQLGRVKEAFELDKMFFIVNASDLAANESELKLVLDYVEDQLLQFGIRNAKIFPVSSKRSLEEKASNAPLNDEMMNFEKEFYRFIEDDLAALTIQAAIWDINRAKTTLSNFIASANLDEKERNKHIEALNEKRATFKKIIKETNVDVSKQRIIERIERQLHFVLERLYIRFHDMFTEHFNPTTITKSGRQAMAELEHNRNNFIDYAGYELLQEVRAVSLRIEAYMKELLKNTYDEMQEEFTSIDDSFIIPSLNEPEIDTPEYEQAFIDIDLKRFDNALKIFKNTKSFFEQNEREKMKEKFYEILRPLANNYLQLQKQMMENVYEEQWTSEVIEVKKRVESEVDSIIDQHIKLLTETIDVEALQLKFEKIDHLVNTIHEG